MTQKGTDGDPTDVTTSAAVIDDFTNTVRADKITVTPGSGSFTVQQDGLYRAIFNVSNHNGDEDVVIDLRQNTSNIADGVIQVRNLGAGEGDVSIIFLGDHDFVAGDVIDLRWRTIANTDTFEFQNNPGVSMAFSLEQIPRTIFRL